MAKKEEKQKQIEILCAGMTGGGKATLVKNIFGEKIEDLMTARSTSKNDSPLTSTKNGVTLSATLLSGPKNAKQYLESFKKTKPEQKKDSESSLE